MTHDLGKFSTKLDPNSIEHTAFLFLRSNSAITLIQFDFLLNGKYVLYMFSVLPNRSQLPLRRRLLIIIIQFLKSLFNDGFLSIACMRYNQIVLTKKK